jgi:anaerobic magnesium-protoporphyrin IX monomethyl ester cyclase
VKIILCAFFDQSLSVRQLSAYLKINHVDVEIVILKEYIDIQNNIQKLIQASIVGISVFTDDFAKAKILVDEIKNQNSSNRPIIIFGGPHPSIKPEECLKYCDYVVRGDGEEVILEICKDISKIKTLRNVSYVEDGKYVEMPLRDLIEELDKYPYPDFSDLKELEEYYIMTSRGCAFNCSFCYNNYMRKDYEGKGKYIRNKSIPYIINELLQAKINYKLLKKIFFLDDNFLSRSKKEIELFVKEYTMRIGMPFFCLANPFHVSEEKIKLLKAAGLESIQIGIQTGSERINYNIYNRKISNKKILDSINLCKKNSIIVYLDIIFNNPYEEVKDLKKTFKLLLKISKPFHLQGYNLIYYPNTDITRKALSDGFILPLKVEQIENSTIQGDENTPLNFINKLENPLWKINYSIQRKVRYNNLITMTEFLPKKFLLLIYFLPGDPLWYAKAWLKLKCKKDTLDKYRYNKLLNLKSIN